MSAVAKLLFVDGWHGPDPGDWQELWASRTPGAARVTQDDWDVAAAGAWVARLDETIARYDTPPVLVAHSLGCPTVVWWAAAHPARPVRAAMLVTPADVECNPRPEITGFAPLPQTPLPFPALVVASGSDSWMSPQRAQSFASAWGARYAEAGDVGHLTVAEGYGPWLAGERYLAELLNGS